MSLFTSKGRSIRSFRRYLRQSARSTSRTRIATSRVKQRASVRMARIKGRSARRQARIDKRKGVGTAGYTARNLHRVTSPGGRKHRIYKGKKQKWSKKYGGWVTEKSYSRRAKEVKEDVSDVQALVKELMPLVVLMKGIT